MHMLTTLAFVAALMGAPPAPLAQDPGSPPPVDPREGLQVIVGPGGTGLEPMAVPEVRCMDQAPAAICRAVADMLRRDMTLSFIYQILPPRSYLVDAQTEPLETPAWNDWNNIGTRWLIKAEVRGKGPFDANFRLFNVTDKSNVHIKEQAFPGVSEAGVRKAVHTFANGVMLARTGVAGVFDTRIAYSMKVGPGVKAIGLVSMDGLQRSGLVSNGNINTLPAWGFGGVVYTSFVDGKPELFIGRKKLTRDDGHYRKVAVSPDGSKMVASVSYGGQSDLYLLAPDGSIQRNLTNTDADEVSPTFSPDGGKIAFVSNQAGSPQIYLIGAGGGGMTRLTHAGGYNYSPDWGKNGLIVFSGMEQGVSDIFSVSEGGEIRRLTQDQGFNKDPSWSRDGRYVAFISTRAEGSGLYLMSADGRYQLLVAKGGGLGNTAWER